MKWYSIVLSFFSIHSMSMQIDLLHQIPDAYVQKIKKEIGNKGPKKMLNLVNRSCNGSLALKAYVIGRTWHKTDFCADPYPFYTEIAAQAKLSEDQLALQVSQIMHRYVSTYAWSALNIAIQLNAERALGFLIQMGENLRPEHLSLSIQKELPHLTSFLLKAGCPVELHYTMLQDHPLVIAIKKRDARAVRTLLGLINPKAKFLYQEGEPAIALEKYLSAEDLKYVDEVDETARAERLSVRHMQKRATS